MRWGATKLQVADLAGAQSKKYLSAIEQPSTSAVSSIIEDTRVHDSLENNANILETKETEKEIDAEAEPSLEERGMAFDNYDRFVDTKPGKDTLHDTVGIMYQNINPKDDNVEEEEEEENEDKDVNVTGLDNDLLRQSISSYHSALKNSKK
ncbi:hypothetical protein J6590_095773 [Homalodisca vitripennis]|nr:hypothetical protein J6590_095773 [Homalodisca vitripennis]